MTLIWNINRIVFPYRNRTILKYKLLPCLDTSAPKVIITPETSDGVLEFNTGDIITINCEAIGSPTATVEWSRDDGVQIYKRVYDFLFLFNLVLNLLLMVKYRYVRMFMCSLWNIVLTKLFR